MIKIYACVVLFLVNRCGFVKKQGKNILFHLFFPRFSEIKFQDRQQQAILRCSLWFLINSPVNYKKKNQRLRCIWNSLSSFKLSVLCVWKIIIAMMDTQMGKYLSFISIDKVFFLTLIIIYELYNIFIK